MSRICQLFTAKLTLCKRGTCQPPCWTLCQGHQAKAQGGSCDQRPARTKVEIQSSTSKFKPVPCPGKTSPLRLYSCMECHLFHRSWKCSWMHIHLTSFCVVLLERKFNRYIESSLWQNCPVKKTIEEDCHLNINIGQTWDQMWIINPILHRKQRTIFQIFIFNSYKFTTSNCSLRSILNG